MVENQYICPICNGEINQSEYLRHVFPDDDYAYFVACAVTHYRHDHIGSYEKMYRNSRYGDKNPLYRKLGHVEYKNVIINNRAKRQLMRGIYRNKKIKIQEKINLIKAVICMRYNDDNTKKLRRELLDKLRHKSNKMFWDSYQPKEYELIEIKNESNMRGVEFQLFEQRYKQARLEI